MTDLMKYLPNFWQDIVEMKATQQAIEPEVDTLKSNISDLLNQCFVSTATWGLDMWEREFGIITNPKLTFTDRRAAVLAKLFGTATSTCEQIKKLTEAITGGKCIVIENNGNYSFIIHFIYPIGVPPNIPCVISAVEKCKPAHLSFSIIYRFITWGEISNKTWGQLLQYTWNDIKTNEEVLS